MTTTTAETLATRDEYAGAIAAALRASAAYYGTGGSALDDASFDLLMGLIQAYEERYPEHTDPASPTGKVAGGAVPAGEVAHTTALLSLSNAFGPEDLLGWEASLVRRLGAPVSGGFVVEPKLDGASLAARYRRGRLVRLVTRGNGAGGEDVSHAIGTLVGLPPELAVDATFEVRGEVLLTAEQFARANATRAEHGAGPFSNARNGAAGTLRAKGRPYTVEMSFWAFGAVALDGGAPLTGATHAEVMAYVAGTGVRTAADTPAGLSVTATVAGAQEHVERIAALRGALPFGIDGVVVKLNGLAEQEAAGSGSRHPHWATAYKLPAVERRTRLLDVTWSVGRTGVLAPTAVLEPVEVDGSVVRHATLHNPADIGRRDLRIGDTVTVYKAGDVIPRVEAPVVELRTGEERPVEPPRVCPGCQGRWTAPRSGGAAPGPPTAAASRRSCTRPDATGSTSTGWASGTYGRWWRRGTSGTWRTCSRWTTRDWPRRPGAGSGPRSCWSRSGPRGPGRCRGCCARSGSWARGGGCPGGSRGTSGRWTQSGPPTRRP